MTDLVELVVEGVVGPEGIGVGVLTALHDRLYFSGYTSATGDELWKYDPGTGQVSMLPEIYPGIPGASPNQLTFFNNKLYFQARTAGRSELWSIDANEQIVMVTNINTTGTAVPGSMRPFDGKLYFSADNGTSGREVYQYDPVSGVTTMAFELGTGAQGCMPYGFIPYGDVMVFVAFTPDVVQKFGISIHHQGPIVGRY